MDEKTTYVKDMLMPVIFGVCALAAKRLKSTLDDQYNVLKNNIQESDSRINQVLSEIQIEIDSFRHQPPKDSPDDELKRFMLTQEERWTEINRTLKRIEGYFQRPKK